MAKAWSHEVAKLHHASVEYAIQHGRASLEALTNTSRFDPRYLEIQVRLHIPFYADNALQPSACGQTIREIVGRVAQQVQATELQYLNLRGRSGIDSLPPETYVSGEGDAVVRSRQDPNFALPLKFGHVDPSIGEKIQADLHYIRSPRKDTLHHFGFFLPGFDCPIGYAAVSRCDRQYQRSALKKVIKIDDARILVMTRAYSFAPLPKNAMGKMFQRIASFYSSQKEFGAIVTALNPLLGFKGSTFLGSSYIPFATSPMAYPYTPQGKYVNRRSSESVVKQNMNTPPILWMARGLIGRFQRVLDANNDLYEISVEEYQAG